MACGIAYMSRRFTSPPEPKKAEPLRYRISPIDKEYDKLDKLDAELEKIADTLEPETYHEYYDILAARRERLEARRLRELGKAPAKVRNAPQEPTERQSYAVPRARIVTQRPGLSPFAVKLLGVCLAVILFKIFS